MCTCFLSRRPVFIIRLKTLHSKSYNTSYHVQLKNDTPLFCLNTLAKSSLFRFPKCKKFELEVVRTYCSKNDKQKRTGKELDVTRENPYAGLSTAEKVKEAGKDASYFAIIIAGLGIMGIMFYTVGKELFSSQSPAGVYGQAFKRCQEDDEVCTVIGEPMTGHGTSGSRRRKQHVSSHEFMVNGVKHMRVVFKIEGPYRKGTVHVEVYQDENKKYQYKYLIVELDGYPSKTIVIENNR